MFIHIHWRYNMFKRLATTAVVLVIVGGSAMADAKMGGIARHIAMGGAGGGVAAFNPFIFEDPAWQYVNPAYQGMYKDYGWSNIGGGTLSGPSTGDNGYGMQHGGINFSVGDGWAVGTVLGFDPSAANTVLGGIAPGGFGPVSGLNWSPVEVLEGVTSYGWDHSHVGFAVMYGWTNEESIDPTLGTSELSASVIGFRAGIHHDMGSGDAVEASAAFRSSTGDDKNSLATANTEGSATEILAAARLRCRVNNKVNFVPYAAFASASGDAKSGGTTVADLTRTAFALGVGGEITSGDLYLAGGLSFAWSKDENISTVGTTSSTTTSTSTEFPVLNLGGEWWFTDWLAGRAGYFRTFSSSKSEFATGTMTFENTSFGGSSFVSVGGYGSDDLVVLGLASRFGNFALETTVSEEALRRGFGLVGAQDNINSFGYFTASWNFE